MPTLLLVEALPKSEGVSEVAVLGDALEVLRRGSDQRRAKHVGIKTAFPRTKTEFLHAVQRSCDYLHISAHGQEDAQGSCIFVRGGGIVTESDLDGVTIQASTVFVNACDAMGDDLCQAFIRATARQPAHYIAPNGDATFDEALLVALLFYKALLFDGKRPAIALHYPYQRLGFTADYRWDKG